jgi:hypothetical protein
LLEFLGVIGVLAFQKRRKDMNSQERTEIGKLRECVQNLAVQVARLSQAVEPLVRMQEEQDLIRDRVAELQGFRAAVLWLAGLAGTGALLRYILGFWTGGLH